MQWLHPLPCTLTNSNRQVSSEGAGLWSPSSTHSWLWRAPFLTRPSIGDFSCCELWQQSLNAAQKISWSFQVNYNSISLFPSLRQRNITHWHKHFDESVGQYCIIQYKNLLSVTIINLYFRSIILLSYVFCGMYHLNTTILLTDKQAWG